MTNVNIKEVAIEKTIKILAELGLKYRKSDFNRYVGEVIDGEYCEASCVITMRGIKLNVFFYDQRGKKLKNQKSKLYNYFNCDVYKNHVTFSYTSKELELEDMRKDNDEDNIKKVMEKVQKLLALSESDNEHEAITASLMAQKLLVKYNIDIECVKGNEDIGIENEELSVNVGNGNKWKYKLAGVIAKNYRCKCFFEGSYKICFYGSRQDIVIARRVYMYLFEVCKRLGKAYEKNERELYGSAQGIYNSYCIGFIHGVDIELSKQCKALMIIIPDSVEKGFEEYSSDFKFKNTTVDVMDRKAYEEGEIEGKRALNAQYIDDNSKYIGDSYNSSP